MNELIDFDDDLSEKDIEKSEIEKQKMRRKKTLILLVNKSVKICGKKLYF